MTRFVLAVVVLSLGLAPLGVVAQSGPTDAPGSVEAAVAARWGVPAADVRVELGPGPDLPGGAVRLLGSGAGGAFVAEVRTAGGDVVRRRLRAGVRRSVPVAARELGRGDVLAAGDIARRDTVVRDPGTGREARVGWVVRRRIPVGAPLAEPAVAPAPAVTAGRAVTLVWRGNGLEVTTRAVAAGTAAEGERVAVRTESGRRIWGVAESAGRVRIGGVEE